MGVSPGVVRRIVDWEVDVKREILGYLVIALVFVVLMLGAGTVIAHADTPYVFAVGQVWRL